MMAEEKSLTIQKRIRSPSSAMLAYCYVNTPNKKWNVLPIQNGLISGCAQAHLDK